MPLLSVGPDHPGDASVRGTKEHCDTLFRDAIRVLTLFAVSVAVGGFANDIFHHFGGAGGLKLGGHTAQGDTENIAVMQFGSGAAGAEFEPEAVDQVDVFGPEPRRMRAQVEEHHVLLIFEYEFE